MAGKEQRALIRLLRTPCPEDVGRLGVQWNVSRLARLRVGATHGEHCFGQVHIPPAERQQLATTQSRVQGEQDHWLEVIGVRPCEIGHRLVAPLDAPRVESGAGFAVALLAIGERRPQSTFLVR
jgi:hypothetical protein